MSVSSIIIGSLMVAGGVAAMKYNYKLVGYTGSVSVFERFLGGGGTYAGFKILAILVIIGGLLGVTGLADPLLQSVFAPLGNFLAPFMGGGS
jgi:hypothetical protein